MACSGTALPFTFFILRCCIIYGGYICTDVQYDGKVNMNSKYAGYGYNFLWPITRYVSRTVLGRPNPEDGGNIFLQNVVSTYNCTRHYNKEDQHRRLYFCASSPEGSTLSITAQTFPVDWSRLHYRPHTAPVQPQKIIQRVLMMYETNTCYC
jgi:hypothetical protein